MFKITRNSLQALKFINQKCFYRHLSTPISLPESADVVIIGKIIIN